MKSGSWKPWCCQFLGRIGTESLHRSCYNRLSSTCRRRHPWALSQMGCKSCDCDSKPGFLCSCLAPTHQSFSWLSSLPPRSFLRSIVAGGSTFESSPEQCWSSSSSCSCSHRLLCEQSCRAGYCLDLQKALCSWHSPLISSSLSQLRATKPCGTHTLPYAWQTIWYRPSSVSWSLFASKLWTSADVRAWSESRAWASWHRQCWEAFSWLGTSWARLGAEWLALSHDFWQRCRSCAPTAKLRGNPPGELGAGQVH